MIHLLHTLVREVFFMCRRNQLLAVFLLGLGVGLLVACRVSSVFWCSCFGLMAVIVGICLLQQLGKGC